MQVKYFIDFSILTARQLTRQPSLFGQAVSNCLVGDSCYFSKFSQLSNVYGLTPISSFKVTVSGRQVFSCDAGNQPKKIFRQPLNYVEILSRQKLIALLAP